MGLFLPLLLPLLLLFLLRLINKGEINVSALQVLLHLVNGALKHFVCEILYHLQRDMAYMSGPY